MKHVIRTERGWGGHFIGAQSCTFRRNTLLECGEQRVIVSTVGNYCPRIHIDADPPAETIGWERFYETMAFAAQFIAPYWEADVSREVRFAAPWAIDHAGVGRDAEANDMHEAVVAELTARMKAGETVVPPPRPDDE